MVLRPSVPPRGSVPSLEHPWLCTDISPRVSLETRQLLWKPPSSSSLTILFLTLGRWGVGMEPSAAHTQPLNLGTPSRGARGGTPGWGYTPTWVRQWHARVRGCPCAVLELWTCVRTPAPSCVTSRRCRDDPIEHMARALQHRGGSTLVAVETVVIVAFFRLKEGGKGGGERRRNGSVGQWARDVCTGPACPAAHACHPYGYTQWRRSRGG